MSSNLFLVANRLPINLTASKRGVSIHKSPGGMASALLPLLKNTSTIWLGYSGLEETLTEDNLKQLGISSQLRPVAIKADLYRRYYYNFANGILWPAFHGFQPRQRFTEADWRATLAVCNKFADNIMSNINPEDRLWIHDFHLFMLPAILRGRGLTNRIGFFLHIPFAKPDWLKKVPHHQDILNSLSTVDLLGVQTGRDARQAQNCFKILAPDLTPPQIGAFPIGVDYKKYSEAYLMPSVQAHLQRIKRQLSGKFVILSASRLDYTKGIMEQLAAIETLLSKPASALPIKYKLIVAPSREVLGEYSDLSKAIESKVTEINRHFGSSSDQPIDYDYRTIGFEELCAWYSYADVLLDTPLIDGMNLVAKEYIAAQHDKPGVVILGKKAGASAQLKSSLLVNPARTEDIVAALQQAIIMPKTARQQRLQALLLNVSSEDIFSWYASFDKMLHAKDQMTL